MMWGYNGFGGFGGGLMGIGMLLFWGLVIFGIVMVVRAVGGRSGGSGGDYLPRERSAVEILRERYARGEIDKSDYEQRLADLERTGPARGR